MCPKIQVLMLIHTYVFEVLHLKGKHHESIFGVPGKGVCCIVTSRLQCHDVRTKVEKKEG